MSQDIFPKMVDPLNGSTAGGTLSMETADADSPSMDTNNVGNPTVMSFNMETKNNIKYAGICIYNMNTNEFSLCEYIENEHFTILESLLIQCRPTCFLYLSSNDKLDDKRIKLILSLCEIKHRELGKSDFYNTCSMENDLSKLLKPTEDVKNCISFFKLHLACRSFTSIVKHMNLLNDYSATNKCVLTNYNINRYLKLDMAATIALNVHAEHMLAEKKTSCNRGSSLTLFTFLNKCKTKIGERKLLQWVMHPIRDEAKINERLDMVSILKEDGVMRSMIQSDYLRKISDLDVIIKKLKIVNSTTVEVEEESAARRMGECKIGAGKIRGGKNACTIEDLVKMYDSVVVSKRIYYCLNDYQGKYRNTLEKNFLTPLKEVLISLDSFVKLIELTVDFDELCNKNFLISRKFDEHLEKLAREKDEALKMIKEHRQEVEDDINHLKGVSRKKNAKEDIKLVDCNVNTFLFRAVKKDMSTIQQRKKTYFQVRMNKSEILFTTNKLKELCKRYEYILKDYNLSQEQLASKAIQVASSYWEPTTKLAKLLAQIDVLSAFAFVSASSLSVYVRPIVETNGQVLHLVESRHPLVESNFLLMNNFIPNDVHMNKTDKRLNIITGPNMGGKSTYIRQIALICLMAQIGCFVPCTYAKMPIFSKIMCRVGSSDIQLKGISTFFSEMIEIAAIIKNAGENTLVIIDELGRGTSTYEGFGISWAVAQYILNKIKCFCLFATHFHEMSNLEYEYQGATNNHVGAKIDSEKKKISFLYEIKKGYADKSYGVHVAQIAKLPQNVIDKAFEKSKELESIENRHYFRTKLTGTNRDDVHKMDVQKRSHDLLRGIFSATEEEQFISHVGQNTAALREVLDEM
ncbi:DNA mismatch repair protein MSH2 [Plasmodium inui San Antonio 1]|uniref:DNA mismatch repair protein MSH2 n=1 Tax=Plasmodium inui San Antonio 1 TaxID=1237626 RepID=W7A0H3_9APIC|nr:DNA mismatch repair protein MSH2 [Plasmodium inui San Antonio 1]EUD66672.1 DNA mismatch repair protein MSH2 [Plasmodium inui San Antonio 1]